MVNSGTVGGAVTIIAPQPIFTIGAAGASGNMVTLTVLLAPHAPGPAVLVVVLPQAADKKYSATMV